MIRRVTLVILFFLSLPLPVWAEKLEYEIYGLDESGKKTLLVEGIKEYADSDVQIVEKQHQGQVHWAKSVALDKGFRVGASIYREHEITGFGIWAEGSRCGFSWEWFKITEPGRYRKLQESGTISVVYRDVGTTKEISEVRFDTDVSLRLNESRDINKKTHRILVKKGSVLKFPPNNAMQGTEALARPCP